MTDVSGNVVTSTDNSAGWNTLLYRGYIYDRETGLYYLNSRYYDPETGRFISADAYISTGNGLLGYNMYAYCLNNPLVFSDPLGFWPNWEKIWSSVGNFFENVSAAFKDSFEAEAGIGAGIKAEILNLGLGISNDTYIGYDEGVSKTGHLATIDVGPVQISARHVEKEGNHNIFYKDCKFGYCTIIDYFSCPHSDITISASLGPVSFSSDGNLSLSVSGGIHAIGGAYFSIGLNLTRFFERVCQ